ncbi:MAG: nitroreductase family deazaflavin-dependent oxidoreductase [Anaerolineae bacterium]|nr:nitroreductase family deazaflavin-dependent oxidoreductase [Anaerolineae bacterium]
MNSKSENAQPPTGWKKLMFRSGIYVYRLGLGGWLGERMLLLNHVGRKSGQPRQAVLEVIAHDKVADIFYVASGYGRQSDWFQNLQKKPDVTIQVRRKKIAVTAVILSPEESGQKLVAYAHQHPQAAKNLGRFLLGDQVDGTDESYYKMGYDNVPVVAFQPRS